ncbi:MAG TPA: hypothetical protein VI643_02305 [Planctomycetota bacterium]|nr:hypothetical protein [Planctomycetota bacterium]
MDPLSIHDALGADHDRIDEVLRRLSCALERSNREGAGRATEKPLRGWGGHMGWEREGLFPSSNYAPWSIDSLKIDHGRIGRSLGELDAAVKARSREAWAVLFDFAIFLEGHNRDLVLDQVGQRNGSSYFFHAIEISCRSFFSPRAKSILSLRLSGQSPRKSRSSL